MNLNAEQYTNLCNLIEILRRRQTFTIEFPVPTLEEVKDYPFVSPNSRSLTNLIQEILLDGCK
jgi:hypothetical protein